MVYHWAVGDIMREQSSGFQPKELTTSTECHHMYHILKDTYCAL